MEEKFQNKFSHTKKTAAIHVPTGFSIKSSIKSKSSLINASKANDVIYEIIGCTDDIMDEVNSIDSSSWVIDRTKRILNDDSLTIRFDHFGSNTFYNNLSLIADKEPDVIAYAVLYSNGDPEVGYGSNRGMSDVLQSLIAKDPVGVGQEVAPLYYQKDLKTFFLNLLVVCSQILRGTPIPKFKADIFLSPKKGMYLHIMPATKTVIKTGLSMKQDLICLVQVDMRQKTKRAVDVYIRKMVNIITP